MRNCEPISPRVCLPLIALGAVLAVGCGYGPVSPAAYGHAKSLYTVANLKAANSIKPATLAIADDASEGVISAREAEWLNAICADCRASRWEAAQAAARRMMEDQADR